MKSGIYTITCIINGKIYVGYTKNLIGRLSGHKYALKNLCHKNPHLQNAVNKYSIENFIFEILEECEKKFLCSQEHYWCVMLNTHNRKFGYNEKPTNPNNTSNTHSAETRKKLSSSLKGKIITEETKKKIGDANRGRVVSQESREKMSISQIGKKKSVETKLNMSKGQNGKKHNLTEKGRQSLSDSGKNRVVSEETKSKLRAKKENFVITWGSKISESLFKSKDIKRRKVAQYDKNLNLIKNWDSLLEVQRSLGINNANLHKCCLNNEDINKNRYSTLKGFIWKFI